MTAAAADTDTDGELSEEELNALTIAQLREVAADMGITLTATKKADIIAEILAAQDADAENPEDPESPADPDTPTEP